MTIKKIIIATLLAMSLSACIGVKFTYNNLDWFIPWYLDDFLVLDKEQEKRFDSELLLLWNWHRQNELPEYSKLLNEIITDLDKQQLSIEKLAYYSTEAEIFYKRVILKSLEQSFVIIASLTDQQLTDLFDSISENDQDFIEYAAETDREERIKKRQHSITKAFKKWLGKLSTSQKQLIKQWSLEAETTMEYHIEYVKRSRKAFKRALLIRNDQSQSQQLLQQLVTMPELLRSDEYNKTIERNNLRFRLLLLDTLKSLSQKQQQHLRKKILKYSEDFSALSVEKTNG